MKESLSKYLAWAAAACSRPLKLWQCCEWITSDYHEIPLILDHNFDIVMENYVFFVISVLFSKKGMNIFSFVLL